MNEMSDSEMEMLEAFLDEELSNQERDEVRARLSSEPALAAELERLRGERETRQAIFESLEGGEEAVVDRAMTQVHHFERRRQTRAQYFRRAFFAVAAAACIVIGFLIGWMGNTNSKSNSNASEPPYRVEIVDETGKTLAVQKFQDLEKAREFQSDLQQWQVRQERLLGGRVTVESGRF